MKRHYTIEVIVGLFLMAAFAAMMVLAFWVSGLTSMGSNNYYRVYADFDNIGGLKVRAPVSIGGVRIGKVSQIKLDPESFRARVTLLIDKHVHAIPDDSTASILTQGLLGANYISLNPGFDDQALKAGDMIQNTHSALILENILGQLIYQVTGKDKGKVKADTMKQASIGKDQAVSSALVIPIEENTQN